MKHTGSHAMSFQNIYTLEQEMPCQVNSHSYAQKDNVLGNFMHQQPFKMLKLHTVC